MVQNTPNESKKAFMAYIEKATERYNVMRLIGGKEVSLKDFLSVTLLERKNVYLLIKENKVLIFR